MKKIFLCAKFDLIPDNTPLGSKFSFSNFNFISIGGTIIIVNETSGEKGMTLQPLGVKIELVAETNKVDFRVGIWDGKSITVIAKDLNGKKITDIVISGHNQYINSSLSGTGMKTIEFDTKGQEELLVSLCIGIDLS